ncbi:MAG: hypothetical protein ACUVXI_18730 [bacterium]
MRKVFIVLDERELLELEAILVDGDRGGALRFLKERVVPKIRKEVRCLSGELSRAQR